MHKTSYVVEKKHSISLNHYLSQQNIVEQKIRFILILGYIRIVVHAENAGLRIERQTLNVVNIALVVAILGRIVETGLVKLKIGIVHYLRIVESLQNGGKRGAIVHVCHTSAIITLASHIQQRFVLHLVVLIQKDLQLLHGYTQVGLVELVRYIPADGAEFASLLDNSVEEAKAEDHLLQSRLVFAGRKEVGIRNGVHIVGAEHIEAKTFGRLVGHFDSVLENGHREEVRRVAGKPKSKVGMCLLGVELFAHLFQRGHPRCGQMAIL